MRIRVVTPPEPIVNVTDIPGAENTERTDALIKAAQNTLAGPNGWLGRSLGPQTLEVVTNAWWRCGWRLPCPPIISIESLSYRDGTGAWQTVADADSFVDGEDIWLRSGFSGPSVGAYPNPIRLRYRAGYDGEDDGTGPIPEEAKQAVVLLVQDMLRTGVSEPGLRSETVEGVGTQAFLDPDKAAAMVARSVDWLVGGLRVWSV